MRKYSLSILWVASSMLGCRGYEAGSDPGDVGVDAQSVVDAAVDATVGADAAIDVPRDRFPIDVDEGSVKDVGPDVPTCTGTLILCNGKCIACSVDQTLIDSANRTPVCSGDGGCASTCKTTATPCASDAGTTCSNFDSDPNACGSCTQRCGLGKGSAVLGQCAAGKCVPISIASPSSADSALVVTSTNVLLFHKDNQIHSCALPACANPNALTASTIYSVPPAPQHIAAAGTPPIAFYMANDTVDGASVSFVARCTLNGCLTPTKHAARGSLGIGGDGTGLFLADASGALLQIDIGNGGAATTIVTQTTAIAQPVVTSTHVYFFQMGAGIYRCPRGVACTTAEKVVAFTTMVNIPYDVVNDTLYYAENSLTPNASRVLSCSVGTTPANCGATNVKVLASNLPGVAGIAADAKAVYFTNRAVSFCTDLVNGCSGAQLGGYVTADADHSMNVRVSGEFIYWVQADTTKAVNLLRAHVPY